MNVEIKKSVFNKVYLQHLENDKRFLIFYGGAGSGKSVFCAQRFIYKILKEERFNLLVVRAVGKTNRDSTFAQFLQIIEAWGISHLFKVNTSEMRISCINSNQIIFYGLDDVEKLKSITFKNGEMTHIWIEEASEVKREDFNQLNLRLRGGKSKKQMVITFNPISVSHWLKERFFDYKEENVFICHTTYKDNEFLDDDYKNQLESYKITDPYYYQVYCLGNWGVYGDGVFNSTLISNRLNEDLSPLRQGDFMYTEKLSSLLNIKWVDLENGGINIYEYPKENDIYIISGDTAGDGADKFAAQVIKVSDKKQVARLYQSYDEDLFAKQVFCLGKLFNDALIVIEANFSSYPNKELERLDYPNIYMRKRLDTINEKPVFSYGFLTDKFTRPLLISNGIRLLRKDVSFLNDKDTLNEMLTFIKTSSGRIEAANGCHDDLVMSLLIALYVREDYIEKEEE